jgi:diguanylate cyclase (GGDEF)-like protein
MTDPPGRDSTADRLVSAVRQLAFARRLETVQSVLESASRDLVGADGAMLALREGNHCRVLDRRAISPAWSGRSLELEECLLGLAILERRPLVVPDVYRDSRVPEGLFRPGTVRALAVLPVRTDDPIAALGVYWGASHQPAPDQLDALQILADSCALALENARMRELNEHNSRGAASELATLNLKLEAANLELSAVNRQLASEVAERRRAEEEVRRASLTDELTGVANRRGFFVVGEERLEEARRAGLECAVIFVDIDGLKRVNDTLGHEVGSAMIRDVASLLRATCPDDAVIGRLGGDEFAVFAAAPGFDPARIEAAIQAAIEAFNAERTRPVELSLSVGGAALQPSAMASLDELLAAADRAMYEHKPEPAAVDEVERGARRFRSAARMATGG